MGLFNIFNSTNKKTPKETTKPLPWRRLTKIEQLDFLANESKTKKVLIFKHSTRCGISKMVFRNFERTFDAENYSLYYLDLLAYRELSNEVGYRFQVLHQSPQVLVLSNNEVVFNASHYAINEADYNLI